MIKKLFLGLFMTKNMTKKGGIFWMKEKKVIKIGHIILFIKFLKDNM